MAYSNHLAISDAIRTLSGTSGDHLFLEDMQVVSVNIGDRTCQCVSLQSNVDDITVRLMASIDDGILYIPTVGSTIICTYSQRTAPFVSMFSEIDQILYIVGDQSITLKNGLFQLNDGSYGGFVKVPELVARLNKVEEALSDLITQYNSHKHITSCGAGSGTADKTTAQETKTVTNTSRDDIENKEATHGKGN